MIKGDFHLIELKVVVLEKAFVFVTPRVLAFSIHTKRVRIEKYGVKTMESGIL